MSDDYSTTSDTTSDTSTDTSDGVDTLSESSDMDYSDSSSECDLSDDGSDELPDSDTDTMDTGGETTADGSDELPESDMSSDKINQSAVNDATDTKSSSSELNSNPDKDIETAFEHADVTYSKDSPTWQENANRYIELNQGKIDELKPQYDELSSQRDSLDQQMRDYIHDNEMTPEKCVTDSNYQDLLNQRNEINQQCEKLGGQIGRYQNNIDGISDYVDLERQTSFKGFNGSNFNDAYNGYVTQQQGHAYNDVQGCCGIDGSVSKINQQTGSNLSEKDGIDQCKTNGWCDYNKKARPGDNGGTNYKDRTDFLSSHGLSNDRVDGAYHGKGQGFSLEDMSIRFNNGESCGLMLKAQDLSQPELSRRNTTFSDFANGVDPKYANHATTVAGFSYDKDGKVSGVWLNDTGGWAGSNRVYLDGDKFNKMQHNTKGFAVEYSKKETK